MSTHLAVPPKARDRVAAYLSAVEHRCPGCARRFEGETAFLQFMLHLDRDLVCRHEFESYLDVVREDAGGA